MTTNETKRALIIADDLKNAPAGIYLATLKESNTFLILLMTHSMLELKKCFLTKGKIIFFFEREDGEEYTMEREFSFEEEMMYKTVEKIFLTDAFHYFHEDDEFNERYFQFLRKPDSMVNF